MSTSIVTWSLVSSLKRASLQLTTTDISCAYAAGGLLLSVAILAGSQLIDPVTANSAIGAGSRALGIT